MKLVFVDPKTVSVLSSSVEHPEIELTIENNGTTTVCYINLTDSNGVRQYTGYGHVLFSGDIKTTTITTYSDWEEGEWLAEVNCHGDTLDAEFHLFQ